MSKISVIIQREYITRVRKKSFIIMTILAPILMASLIIGSGFLMTNQDTEHKKIAVLEQGPPLFDSVLKNTKDAEFVYLKDVKEEDLRKTFEQQGYYGILVIYPEIVNVPNAIRLISKQQPPIMLLEHIEGTLEKDIERKKLLSHNIENLDEIMKQVDSKVSVETVKIDDSGQVKQTSTGISMVLAYIGGFLMYMLVFIFGAQVMRGVIEEKTSRVVEVIISSVKPIELMLGKIIGIALVGLTQFLIWVVLTVVAVAVLKSMVTSDSSMQQIVQNIPQDLMSQQNMPSIQINGTTPEAVSRFSPEFTKIFSAALNQPWGLIIFCFIFYFVTGYLLYASVFAAIGSAVDNETETQQFMLPVTIPIILALFVAMSIMQNPESSIAFWFSLIPLTSPIVMMARIPFDPPFWQIALSMGLMLITFGAFVWMAAKIYRTGILMYGKKSSWKEMWKWLRYN